MKARKLLNVIVVSLIMSGVGVGWQVAAQDATPAPEQTEVAPVPVVPTAIATAVDTAPIPTNPRGDLQLADFVPYLVLIIGVLILGVVTLGATAFVLLYKSSPPAVQAVSLSVVNSLLAQMKAYTDSTPSKLDDAIDEAIQSKWDDLVKQLTAAVG